MNAFYTLYKVFYKETIKAMINMISVDLVVYDETEHFRDYNDPLFYYPYAPRRTQLSNLKFTIPEDGSNYQLT